MTKIMIIDTVGADIPDAYRELLPEVKWRGIEPSKVAGTPCGPHGAFCGWLAAVPVVGAGIDLEVVFVRVFDEHGEWISDSDQFILDTVAAERPDVISRSYGAWDGDHWMYDQAMQIAHEDWAAAYRALHDKIGFLDFGAAGNEDKNDADSDVAYPQALITDFCNIIGACNRAGVPTEWSGDGRGVQCVMWADRIYSPDLYGQWCLWSGTSAACPKAAGVAAALGIRTLDAWRARVMKCVDPAIAAQFELPHPKFGYGCMEDPWQNFARRLHPGRMPSPAHKPIALYHDYAVRHIEIQETP